MIISIVVYPTTQAVKQTMHMIKLLMGTALAMTLAMALASPPRATGAPAISATNSVPAAAADDPVLARGKDFVIRRSAVDQVLATSLAGDASAHLPPNAVAQVLGRLIELQLVWQQATAAEKAAGAQLADQRFAYILKTLGAPEMARRLQANHMTEDDLRRSLAETMTAKESLPRQLGIQVTEDDLQKYYDENPAASEQAERARVREILLATSVGSSSNPLPDEAIRAKHAQILELHQQIEAGANFAALARKYNEDPISKDTGGVMPPFRARNTEFGSLALSMQTNQISGVLTNEEGYRIFQLLEKIPAKKFAFAAVTNKIKNYIIAGKTADLAPAYIAQLRQAAGVEILDAGLKTEFAEAEARAAEEAKNPPGFQATKAPPMGP